MNNTVNVVYSDPSLFQGCRNRFMYHFRLIRIFTVTRMHCLADSYDCNISVFFHSSSP